MIFDVTPPPFSDISVSADYQSNVQSTSTALQLPAPPPGGHCGGGVGPPSLRNVRPLLLLFPGAAGSLALHYFRHGGTE